MDAVFIVAIAVGALLLVAAVYVAYQRKQDAQLRDSFGSEYDRTVAESGSRSARSELSDRAKRVSNFDIRPLTDSAKRMYSDRWVQTQARFVDDPARAIKEADTLVVEVMSERGYPMEDFDQRAADLSVEYPEVVHDYRAAHGISLASDQGAASTEDQRQAMIYYRSLFANLLETDDPSIGTATSTVDLREEQTLRQT
jgi:hypothetical protein